MCFTTADYGNLGQFVKVRFEGSTIGLGFMP